MMKGNENTKKINRIFKIFLNKILAMQNSLSNKDNIILLVKSYLKPY